MGNVLLFFFHRHCFVSGAHGAALETSFWLLNKVQQLKYRYVHLKKAYYWNRLTSECNSSQNKNKQTRKGSDKGALRVPSRLLPSLLFPSPLLPTPSSRTGSTQVSHTFSAFPSGPRKLQSAGLLLRRTMLSQWVVIPVNSPREHRYSGTDNLHCRLCPRLAKTHLLAHTPNGGLSLYNSINSTSKVGRLWTSEVL